jgi:hypothetical protein
MKSKYKLGQEVTVLHRLVRERQGVKISWKVNMYPKPLKGILVGVRILNDGYMEGNYGEQYYVPVKPKKALLVAINLKQTILMFA